MTYETVLPMWDAVRNRFFEKAVALMEEDLSLKLGDTTIGHLLFHTGEVEYIFADWYFGKSKGEIPKPSFTNKEEQVAFLLESNQFLKEAMKDLPEEKWHEAKETRMGSSTPLEVMGRLMYHTGIHSGQISDIKKFGK